jgi:hypothetical protein
MVPLVACAIGVSNALPEPGNTHGDRSCRGGTVWLRNQHPAGLQETVDHC